MSTTDPNSKAIPPDLNNLYRNLNFQPNSDFLMNSGNRGRFPAPDDEPFHPSLSSGVGEQSLGPAARNSQKHDREMFFSPNSEFGNSAEQNGIEPTILAAAPLHSHSPITNDHIMEYIDPCPIDNTQAQLTNSLLNSARTEPGLSFSSDKLHYGVASSGNTNSNHQLIDNSGFESSLNIDTINRTSNINRKLENAKLLYPIPLNIENPAPMKAVQNSRK
ncbi:hypothetical protein LXL04_037150 [Taraxacum kok-saghyz]